jgi:25S rRNA (uracil2634-N3)-methyltransferase
MLQGGTIPGLPKKKKKKVRQEGDSDEEDDKMSLHTESSDMDEQCPPSTRGTVLITLRNVVPYTQW